LTVRRIGGDPASPWEQRFGYSRVVVAGPFILIGGTTSVDEDGVVLGGSAYDQTTEVFSKLSHELTRAGASLTDVIQVRVYTTDISLCDEICRAFTDVLGAVHPLMTMVEVSALVDPRMLVEIELVAYH
jgi:enamine deaminase RidA (YjgF/YER057c/UK114 family)